MSKIHISIDKIEDYKRKFTKNKCFLIKNLIEEEFFKEFVKKLEKVSFYEKEEAGEYKFGKVMFVPLTEPSVFILNVLLNDKTLFSALEEITNCSSIKDFVGRIHRSEGKTHEIKWHGDNSDNRLLAITLCLGEDRFEGAKFQLREKESKKMLAEFGQLEPGDAIIFQISPELEHRLSPIMSGKRTVGVGWFRG